MVYETKQKNFLNKDTHTVGIYIASESIFKKLHHYFSFFVFLKTFKFKEKKRKFK